MSREQEEPNCFIQSREGKTINQCWVRERVGGSETSMKSPVIYVPIVLKQIFCLDDVRDCWEHFYMFLSGSVLTVLTQHRLQRAAVTLTAKNKNQNKPA